jgi:drug/metabolite transporter (DMT)-like permease
MKAKSSSTIFAILAAALYALSAPVGKVLLGHAGAAMMAAFLYLGAGLGLALWGRIVPDREASPITRQDLPYILGMILLDITAPILLMLGLQRTGSANASLLNNFEIVATSLIAWLLFREKLSRRLSLAIVLVTFASIVLGYEGSESLRFGAGSALVLAAACCWGLENNCTRMLSRCSSVQITTIKGIFSGLGSLIVAFCAGESLPGLRWIPAIMLLGFVAYGLSINFYIKAQKELGAAKTSAWYSIAPFLGVVFGIVLLGERPDGRFFLGLGLMVLATLLMVFDTISLQHTHEHAHIHCHEHRHGDQLHIHEHTHIHAHNHVHGADKTTHEHQHAVIENHNHAHS